MEIIVEIPKIVKVAALPIEGKKLLLVRSFNKDVFYTLGGKLEANESEVDCLKREISEEVGSTISEYQYFKTFEGPAHGKNARVVLICYFVKLAEPPKASSEIEELHWWDSQSTVKLSEMLEKFVIPELKDCLS